MRRLTAGVAAFDAISEAMLDILDAMPGSRDDEAPVARRRDPRSLGHSPVRNDPTPTHPAARLA